MKQPKTKVSREKQVVLKRAAALAKKILDPIKDRVSGFRIETEELHWFDAVRVRFCKPGHEQSPAVASIVVQPTHMLGSREAKASVQFQAYRSRSFGGIPRSKGFTRKQGPKQADDAFAHNVTLALGIVLSVELAAMQSEEQEYQKRERLKKEAEEVLSGIVREPPHWWRVSKDDHGLRVRIEPPALSRERARLLYRAVNTVLDTKVFSDDLRVHIEKPSSGLG